MGHHAAARRRKGSPAQAVTGYWAAGDELKGDCCMLCAGALRHPADAWEWWHSRLLLLVLLLGSWCWLMVKCWMCCMGRPMTGHHAVARRRKGRLVAMRLYGSSAQAVTGYWAAGDELEGDCCMLCAGALGQPADARAPRWGHSQLLLILLLLGSWCWLMVKCWLGQSVMSGLHAAGRRRKGSGQAVCCWQTLLVPAVLLVVDTAEGVASNVVCAAAHSCTQHHEKLENVRACMNFVRTRCQCLVACMTIIMK
jgi:hypothetical protein